MTALEAGIWVSLIASAVRLSTPLILAALGGLFSERSGVINIALEGLMLIGAFAAAAGNIATGSPWLGLLIGMSASTLLAFLHAVCCVTFRANQVVCGMAINILAFGLAPFLGKVFFDSTGSTPSVSEAIHFHDWSLPVVSSIPAIGQILGTHTPIVFLSIASVAIVHFWFYRFRGGLRLRAVGEHPAAAESAGISVAQWRYFGVLMSGVFCGMAGAFLSIGLASNFSRNMTAGRGFIALTALIFGKWKPVPVFLACLLFGFADALQIRLQGVALPIVGEIPPQFVQILPYVITLVVLAGFIGQSRAPKALGQAYIKEE